MEDDGLACPRCSAGNLLSREPCLSGLGWPISLGRSIWRKDHLVAHACNKCGFVFLELKLAREVRKTKLLASLEMAGGPEPESDRG